MKRLSFFILFFFTFSALFQLYSDETVDLALDETEELIDSPSMLERRIILVKPEVTIEGSTESFIFSETEALLERLESEGKMEYLREGEWRRYRAFLNYEDRAALADFYLNTGVTGVLRLFIEEDERGTLLVKVNIFDLKKKKSFDYRYYLDPNKLNSQLLSYKKRLERWLAEHFPPEELDEVASMKYKVPPFVRVNPDYQVALSGGAGFYMKQIYPGNPGNFAFGPLFYFKLDASVKRFNLRLHLEGGPLFYEPFQAEQENGFSTTTFQSEEGPIPNLFASLDFGGWFKNHVFKLGGGLGVGFSSIYYSVKENQGDNQWVRTTEFKNYLALFIYMNFTLQPYRNVLISVDFGSFLSPDQLSYITPSPFIPFYFRLLFRYYFYKGLFMEFCLPFYAIGMGDMLPYPNLMFELGLGWRFEWRRK